MNNPVNAGDARVNEYFSNMNREGTYYDTQEKVFAGYVMNKTQIDNVMLLAGVRVEHTRVNYKANKIEPYVDPNAPIQNDNPEHLMLIKVHLLVKNYIILNSCQTFK